MAIYRKVDRRLWNDQRFRALSERGKLLWLYLLTCPETLAIPGVIVVGRMALMEALGWPEQAASPVFAEIFGEGIGNGIGKGYPNGTGNGIGYPPETLSGTVARPFAIADFQARLVWLPNALKYNRPDNVNVLKSWAKQWDSVPECSLKVMIWEQLKRFLEGFPKPFREGFLEGFPKPFAIPTQEGIENIEQEQEQEQELVNPLTPLQGEPRPKPTRKVPARKEAPEKVPVPESLGTAEFTTAWLDWLADRAKRRKPLTERAATEQLRLLEPLGPLRAVECIRLSIANGWQGLFPERFLQQRKPQQQHLDRGAQQEARIIQQMRESMEMP